MTPEEIKKKTDEKVNLITEMCKKLQITLSAEEVILDNGLIRKVIYYIDNENYPKKEVIKEKKDESTNL